MKKSKKIILIITIILLIILAIFTSIKIYQYNTVMKITDAVKAKRDSLNFFYEINEENVTYRVYAKNNKVKRENVDKDGNIVHIFFTDTNTKQTHLVWPIDKVYTLMTDTNFGAGFVNLPDSLGISINAQESNLLEKINFALSIKSITHDTLDNKDTLKINFNYPSDEFTFIETIWFDSNTLYPVKVDSDMDDHDATIKLTDCPLSEEEVTFTNKEGYTEVTNDNSEIESSEEN